MSGFASIPEPHQKHIIRKVDGFSISQIGQAIRYFRLQKNLDEKTICELAGTAGSENVRLYPNALERLEAGRCNILYSPRPRKTAAYQPS